MRLILDRALFTPQSPRESVELARLLLDAALTELQRPAVLVDPPYTRGGDNQELDTWLDERGTAEADLFRGFLEQGNVDFNGPRGAAAVDTTPARPAWRLAAAPEVRVERRPASDWPASRLTLHDAIDLLHEPVHLVLENERNDLAFVCHLAGPTDGPVLRRLDTAAGRLRVHGGGRDEGKVWLEALANPPITAEKWRRVLRTWVLFDQDAGDPDAREPSVAAERMMAACERVHAAFAVGLTWVCLRRREIESYVPDAGLAAAVLGLPGRQPMAQQIIAWRGTAQPGVDLRRHAWAFDLKKGLLGDLRGDLSEEERGALKGRKAMPTAAALKTPFDSLANADVARLAYGLGDGRLNDALTQEQPPGWASDIPAEYDRGPAHQAPRLALVQSLFDRV